MSGCAHTQQVLARHLDGDVALPFALELSPLELVEHLSECDTCHRDLQRARRLDAALAATAGVQLAPAAVDALAALADRAIDMVEDMVEAERAPPRQPRSRRSRFTLRLAAGAAGITAVFALAQATLPPAPPGRPAPPMPRIAAVAAKAAAAAAAPVADASASPAPLFTTPLPKPRGGASVLRPARTRAEVQVLGDLLLNGVEPAGVAAQTPRSPFADAVELRLQAAGFLLDGGRADAADAWVAAVAGLDAGPLLQGLLLDGRHRPQLLQRLAHLLRANAAADDPATPLRLCAAARLGARELDQSIAWLLRRQPELIDSVAAALRAPVARPQRSELLLSVWADLVARGGADDDATAQRLFAEQPPSCTGELLAALDCARAPERRRICLALGVLGDVQAEDRLLGIVDGGGRDEAMAAAWAIGRMPNVAEAAPQLLANAASPPWLLRAALTQAGAPVSKQWLAELDLTPAERALLAGGPLSLRQFAVAAAWFRDRLHQGQ